MSAVVITVAVFKYQDWKLANCRTEPEIIALLGPSTRSFIPGDETWKELCQSWGCESLRGEPDQISRIDLHKGSWFWTGYLIFYDNETVVGIYALGIG